MSPVMPWTWLLSGVPRSGTSLCCRLAGDPPDTVLQPRGLRTGGGQDPTWTMKHRKQPGGTPEVNRSADHCRPARRRDGPLGKVIRKVFPRFGTQESSDRGEAGLVDRDQARTVWFYRDYVRLTGGHLKHSHYFDHVLRMPGFAPRITFSGEPSNCLPRAEEGFYLPALEAMASGCLVVTLDCIGNRGFRRHDDNCLVAESSPESLFQDDGESPRHVRLGTPAHAPAGSRYRCWALLAASRCVLAAQTVLSGGVRAVARASARSCVMSERGSRGPGHMNSNLFKLTSPA